MNNNNKFYAIFAKEGVAIVDSIRNEVAIREQYLPHTMEVKVFDNYENAHWWLYQRSVTYAVYLLGIDNMNLFVWPLEINVNTYILFPDKMISQIEKVRKQEKFLPMQLID